MKQIALNALDAVARRGADYADARAIEVAALAADETLKTARDKMVEAARKYNRMVQVGSQSRSMPKKMRAIELLNQGVIGQVYHARALCFRRRFSIGSNARAACTMTMTATCSAPMSFRSGCRLPSCATDS